MKSRVFEQFYDDKENAGIVDVVEYACSMHYSLKSIKEYYASFFNANHTRNIDEVIKELDDTFDKIAQICIDKYDVERYKEVKESSTLEFEWFDFVLDNMKSDVLKWVTNTTQKINLPYYEKLLPLVNKMFELEEECHPVVKQIWKTELTGINEYDKNKPFGLLIKVLDDWRENIDDPKKEEYMRSRFATSTSYVTHEKVRKFDMQEYGSSDFGFVYESNDGIMAANKTDAFLEEAIDFYNPIDTRYPSDLKCIHREAGHEIFASTMSTKLDTPKAVINTNHIKHNEVVLDVRKAKPSAVCYFSYGQKFLCKDYEKAVLLSQDLNLPLIEIPYINLNNIKETYLKNEENVFLAKEKFEELSDTEKFDLIIDYKQVDERNLELLAKSLLPKEYQTNSNFCKELNCKKLIHIIIEEDPQTKEELDEITLNYAKKLEKQLAAKAMLKKQASLNFE